MCLLLIVIMTCCIFRQCAGICLTAHVCAFVEAGKCKSWVNSTVKFVFIITNYLLATQPTSCIRDLEKMLVTFMPIMEPECSLPFSQDQSKYFWLFIAVNMTSVFHFIHHLPLFQTCMFWNSVIRYKSPYSFGHLWLCHFHSLNN